MTTLGIGFIGQGEAGRFHLERFRLRSDCLCEAAWLSARDLTHGSPTRLAKHIVSSIHDVSFDSRISLVVIDVPSTPEISAAGVAAECLSRGKHVIVSSGSFNGPDELDELNEVAKLSGRHIFVAALHRWESAFLGVQSVVASGCLGEMRQITKVSRQYVPEELAASGHIVRDSGQSLDQLWFEMLFELLQFWPRPIKVANTSHVFITVANGNQVRTGRSAQLEFEGGCRAHLELNRHSLAPLETGWVFEGQIGGYADRKKYRATADFELVDVPIEFPPTNQNAFYDAVIATIRDGRSFPITLDSVKQVLDLMRERDRGAESLAAGTNQLPA